MSRATRAPGGARARAAADRRGWRPSGVVLMTTVHAQRRRAAHARRAPAHSSNAAAGSAEREATATGTPRSHAAPTTAAGPAARPENEPRRPAAPPARRAPRAGPAHRCCRRPVAPSSPQKVLHAPSRSHHRLRTIHGLRRRPPCAAPSRCRRRPAWLSDRMSAGHVVGSGSGARRRPHAVRGRGTRRSAWPGRESARRGRPGRRRRASSRRSPHRAGDPAHHGADELLQLGVGRTVAGEIGPVRDR